MPRHSKPRAGSLGFKPRKRAKRIYPRVRVWSISEKTKIQGFAAYKAGMSQVMIMDNRKNSPTKGQEISVPVTILDCPPLKVLGIRTYKETPDGFTVFSEVWADVKKDKDLDRKLVTGNFNQDPQKIEKEFDKIKRIRLIVKTQPRQSLGKKTPEVFEIGVSGENVHDNWNHSKELMGKEIRIKDVFKEGELVDAIAVTKGKGTQGSVKRFGVKIQERKAHGKMRHIGSLGSETPRRVLWTVPMAGQLGFHNRTELNKRVLKIGGDGKEITPKSGFTNYGLVRGDYIILEGSIPGPKKRLIILRSAIRKSKTPVLIPEIKHIKV